MARGRGRERVCVIPTDWRRQRCVLDAPVYFCMAVVLFPEEMRRRSKIGIYFCSKIM